MVTVTRTFSEIKKQLLLIFILPPPTYLYASIQESVTLAIIGVGRELEPGTFTQCTEDLPRVSMPSEQHPGKSSNAKILFTRSVNTRRRGPSRTAKANIPKRLFAVSPGKSVSTNLVSRIRSAEDLPWRITLIKNDRKGRNDR